MSPDTEEDRVAVVTGAGSGIGRQIAVDLATDGTTVIAIDVRRDRLDTLAGEVSHGSGRILSLPGDVRCTTTAVELCHLAQEFGGGRVDGLVNCAGVADLGVPTVEQDIEGWQAVLDISLRGAFILSQAVVREFMVPQHSGSIVNIGSIAGLVGLPQRNAYSAAKAGLMGMTRAMSAELGRLGIRVNVVAPGYVRSHLTEPLFQSGLVNESELLARIPAGRLGTPDDMSAAVRFLLSESASYISGQCLVVDGGLSAYGGPSFYDS